MRTILYFISLISILLVAVACKHKEQTKAIIEYTCSMHPQIIRDKPGICPICKMDLVPLSSIKNDDGIILSEDQIALANISMTPVVKNKIGEQTMLSGRLVSSDEQIEIVSSRVSGRIEKLYYK